MNRQVEVLKIWNKHRRRVNKSKYKSKETNRLGLRFGCMNKQPTTGVGSKPWWRSTAASIHGQEAGVVGWNEKGAQGEHLRSVSGMELEMEELVEVMVLMEGLIPYTGYAPVMAAV